MEFPTIFSTIPNSVRGSTVFNFSKCRDKSRTDALLIKQCPADSIDLAGNASIEVSFQGVDDEIATFEPRIFLNGNRRIGALNRFADPFEVVTAHPHFNSVMTVGAFQR